MYSYLTDNPRSPGCVRGVAAATVFVGTSELVVRPGLVLDLVPSLRNGHTIEVCFMEYTMYDYPGSVDSVSTRTISAMNVSKIE